MLDSFLYQYLVGGLLFALGICCGVRTGVFSWQDEQGRRRLLLMLLGMLLFIVLQGAFLLFGK